MSSLVIDASVAAKWLVTEAHSDEATNLRKSAFALIAPEHFVVELASAMLSKVRRRQLSAALAMDAVRTIEFLPVGLRPAAPLLTRAGEIAIRYDRSVYDSLYITLALAEECQFVTADRRLYNALAPVFSGTMLWVEDIPVF